MSDRDPVAPLRGAIYGTDHDEVVALLRDHPWPAYSLQLIGDGLVAAARAGADGAADLARACAAQLHERDWEGDHLLAEALRAAVGDGPAPDLRALPVDLEEMVGVLEGDPLQGGGRIDLRTGEVWPDHVLEYMIDGGEMDEDAVEDLDRWLILHCEGSRSGYRDMEWFIELCVEPVDETFAERLGDAIAGRGAFRRFKDVLWRREDLFTLWHAFSNDRQRGRSRSWLAVEGYTPLRQG